jgi:hypothetical protein
MVLYPCLCCGFLMFSEPSGSYGICSICFWEDDYVQLRSLAMGGANHVSLIEAQRNFAAIGACEERVLQYTRPPLPEDKRDPTWRPVDPTRDLVDVVEVDTPRTYLKLAAEYYSPNVELYYWRS